jgi:hypothetical protein
MMRFLVCLCVAGLATAFVPSAAPGSLMTRSAVSSTAAVSMFSGGSKAAPKKAVKKVVPKKPVKAVKKVVAKKPVKKVVAKKVVAKKAPVKKAAPVRKAAPKKPVPRKTGKVNPALFSSGIDKKTLDRIKKEKFAEQKRVADLKKKNLPLFSLPSLLPNRPKAGDVRSDGSFKFPKPWEK